MVSLLNNDLYKFTMMQAVLHQFPATEVEYTFKNRTKNINLLKYKNDIELKINEYCSHTFIDSELEYLSKIRFFKKDFIQFLKLYKPDKKYIKVYEDNGDLAIKVSGPWLHTILFEVPILYIVNEVYSSNQIAISKAMVQDNVFLKMLLAEKEKINFSDFGTRRRNSHRVQEYVIQTIIETQTKSFTGTSNVYFAKKFELTPIGTMAHEWLQAGQALGVRVVDSQKFMLEKWVQEYRGDLGIALTDVIGVDAFIRDFDLYFAKLYDGVRHDSGNPFDFGDKIINHYKKLKIEPKTKTIVFSDGLDFKRAVEINHYFKNRINVSFGIGTNLTNDPKFGGTPLQVVMKLTKVNGSPVAKISDTPEKGMCEDQEYVNYVKKVFGVKN